MKERVAYTISKNKLITEGDNILLGVSGGPDSMVLLYVLRDIQNDIKFNLLVAHVNHGIRDKESDGDELYVKDVCKKMNIPIYSTKVNMNEYAKKHKLSSEEAGREIRYKFFREKLMKIGGGKIAVAHNKNDQAETLILRFIRGTGIDGLKGMEYKNNDIIRPLLDVSRDEIEKYCKDNNINPRIDKTNKETKYRRNKVRLELIPYIEKNFNTGIIDTLVRTSRIMQTDSDFLNEYSSNKYKTILVKEEKDKVILDNEKFLGLHKGIKARVLRYSIEKLFGYLKGIEEKNINDILDLSSSKNTGKSLYIGNNVRVKINYNELILERITTENKVEFREKLDTNSFVCIECINTRFAARVINRNDYNINLKDRFIKYFDYDKIKGNLLIRNRKQGDRFIPLGMKGKKKIKDFFIDEKIPRDKRDKIPLIVDEEDVLWVVGYRISDKYKITDDTERVLEIKALFEQS